MNIAPIILFVFNRPEHTKKTIESLKKNQLCSESDLFIFSDGPRSNFDVDAVAKVRQIIQDLEGFKSISIKASDINCGLASSVITGVSDVIKKFGRAIILEDDLLFSPYFLTYMNEALNRYENHFGVFSVGGYSPPIEMPKTFSDDSYLSYRCCTWGWATWSDRWSKVDWGISGFKSFIANDELVSRFNRGGDDMSQILRLQMEGKISSWGIRWDYAHFKNDAYCFRPSHSIVSSTGNDGSGVHCGVTSKFDVNINTQSNFYFPGPEYLKLDEDVNRRFATFYDGKLRVDSSFKGDAINYSRLKKLVKLLFR